MDSPSQNKLIFNNDTDDVDYDIGGGFGGVEGGGSGNNTISTNATSIDNDSNSLDNNEEDVVSSILNEEGKLIGYQCDHVVQTNTLQVVELVFYLDVSSPTGLQKDAINFLSSELVENVAMQYEISDANSKACTDPHLDGRSWLVQFSASPTDFKRVDLFDECRKYPYDKNIQDCFVYEALVRGSALGSQDIPDVMKYIENVFDSNTLSKGQDQISYGTAFLGVPVVQNGVSDEGRDNLGSPTNVNEAQQGEIQEEPEKQSVTIIGGFLVALFAIGFCGIGMVLWKRRKAYIEHNREMKLSLHQSRGGGEKHHNNMSQRSGSSDDDDDGLHQYGTHGTTPSDEDAYHHHNHHHRGDRGLDVVVVDHGHGQEVGEEVEAPPDLASPTPTEEDFPNDVTFDLGSTFKNQLMGTHASSGNNGPPPPRPYGSSSNSGRNSIGMMGMMGFRGNNNGGPPPYAADGTDASEADSWAQTDGTIGSLEIQLEPVTAEV